MPLRLELVNSVIEHDNSIHLLHGIVNETNTWFYHALSQMHPDMDIDKTKKTLGKAMTEYLSMMYRLYRQSGMTTQPFEKFILGKDPSQAAMTYLLKSLRLICGQHLFFAAIVALWVDLERKEDDFIEYVRKSTGTVDYCGDVVNPVMMINYVCASLVDSQTKAAINN
ncbi:MAG TPA: hypothetical protein PK344_14855 [Syntrophorhabdaceae bacterium]|jgi:hypothetical protein|nr:hypothetical protein [Syntrophorhabdaceae bacterium]